MTKEGSSINSSSSGFGGGNDDDDDDDKNKKKPRIVYAGSGAHFDVGNKTEQQDDFTHVIKFIADNVDKYQFVFIGAVPPPLQKFVFDKKIEFHPWKNLMQYPNKSR
jgi:hypothetical protein